MKNLTVFCGSNFGTDPLYAVECENLAETLVSLSIDLVYGGGKVGLMGHLADSMLKLGGKVIGVIPERLADKEVAHKDLTELIVVKTMHERKAIMAELSEGFIALPGGIGTLEEIMEVFTWTQLGYHSKPCGLLNVNGFYDKLDGFLQAMTKAKFLKDEHKSMLLIDNNANSLVRRLLSTRIEYRDKWVEGPR